MSLNQRGLGITNCPDCLEFFRIETVLYHFLLPQKRVSLQRLRLAVKLSLLREASAYGAGWRQKKQRTLDSQENPWNEEKIAATRIHSRKSLLVVAAALLFLPAIAYWCNWVPSCLAAAAVVPVRENQQRQDL